MSKEQDQHLRNASDQLGVAIRALTEAQKALKLATDGNFQRAGTIPAIPVYQVTPEHESKATPAPKFVLEFLTKLKRGQ